ncbi:MAG: TRAP transporter small permease [Candidatus Marinimicrobia bacterium]|nr:TRAP transporter small permease [Candidatus Neomarinimicrobiota bacterium]
MKKIITGLDTFLKWAVILIMGVNVINVLWQVFTRFILNNPSAYTEEIARYLLIWLGLLGATYAYRLRMHVAIDYIQKKFSEKLQYGINVIIQVCVFAFSLFVLLIGGLRLVTMTFTLGQTSAALQIQMGYVYLAIPVSGIFIMFYSILFIIDYSREWAGKNPILVEDK